MSDTVEINLDDLDGPTIPRTITPLETRTNIVELEERFNAGGIFTEDDIRNMIDDLRLLRNLVERAHRLGRAAGLAQRTLEEARNIAEAKAKHITGEMIAVERVSLAHGRELDECRDALLAERMGRANAEHELRLDIDNLWEALGSALALVDSKASMSSKQQRELMHARDLHGMWTRSVDIGDRTKEG